MSKISKLPDTELEVMRVIWSSEKPISTTDIRKVLEKDKPWSIGALQTLLVRLSDRGFVSSYMEGKCKIFTSLISEDEYLAFISRSFLSKLSRNSVTRLISALYESNSISDEDLDELDRFIESKKKQRENLYE